MSSEWSKMSREERACACHDEIENNGGSDAFKLLCHHFEVVCNSGKCENFSGEKCELFEGLNGLEMSEDELLCVKSYKMPMKKMLKCVDVWGVKCSYGGMSKDMTLGHLWLVYRGVIIE